ncbi:MAG: hypothetical protein ACRDHE_18005, partial [Ktedonobacterales bacterium]
EAAKDYAVERGMTVERWQQSFELDNFSDNDLAEAISAYARGKGWPEVTSEDVAECRRRFPNKSLDGVIAQTVRESAPPGSPAVKDKDYEWDKVTVGRQLAGKLIERVAKHQPGDLSEAPVIDVISHVVQMARENWP